MNSFDTAHKAKTSHESASQTGVTRADLIDLLNTEYDGLVALIRRKVRRRELAEDLLNEAVVITLENFQEGRIATVTRIGGYVFSVCMNLLRNYDRNMDNRQEARESNAELDSLSTLDSNLMESEQMRKKARQVLESLPSAREREVVKRFYLDEEDKQAICEDLKLTPIQFTQITSRARKRMKAVFDAEGVKRTDFFSLIL